MLCLKIKSSTLQESFCIVTVRKYCSFFAMMIIKKGLQSSMLYPLRFRYTRSWERVTAHFPSKFYLRSFQSCQNYVVDCLRTWKKRTHTKRNTWKHSPSRSNEHWLHERYENEVLLLRHILYRMLRHDEARSRASF